MFLHKKNRLLLLFALPIVLSVACGNAESDKTKTIKSTNKDSISTSPKIFLEETHNVLDTLDSTFYVYLTFDDGPYHTTPSLTKFLNQKQLKSSFFVIGSQIDYTHFYDSVFNDVKNNPLFRVYNHTYTHAVTKGRIKKYYADPNTVYDDLTKNKKFLPEGAHITRLPGTNAFRVGKYEFPTNKAAKRVINFLDSIGSNEVLFGWNVIWETPQSKDTAGVNKLLNEMLKFKQSKSKYHNHCVILFHDYYFGTPTSLDNLSYLIDLLKNKYHCTFRWAAEFPGV